MPREEKSKFEFEEKKFSSLLKREVCRRFCLKAQLSVINWTFFSSDSNFDFSSETTQNDHNRLLYKFENDHKNFGCVGSCGYVSASVNTYSGVASQGRIQDFNISSAEC